MTEPSDARTEVRAALEIAHLSVMDHEFEALVAKYPDLRSGADSLYIDALRYEEPALIFTPVLPKKTKGSD